MKDDLIYVGDMSDRAAEILAKVRGLSRADFRPDSDIDVLVTFEPDDPWSAWDMIEMRDPTLDP